MKIILRKHCAAALLCTLLLSQAVSCSDNRQDGGKTGTTTAAESGADTEAETLTEDQQALAAAIAKLEGVDYEGYNFRIMDRSKEEYKAFYTIDVWAEAEDGDVITDAVYRRNRHLEENMNIVVSEIPVTQPKVYARQSIMAGSDDFDAVTEGISLLAPMATDGLLLDMNEISTMKLTESWWDQQMRTDLSVADKLFFMTGDISIMDNYGTWCFMFNKKLVGDYDLDDPYELVRSGKWTLEKMYDMAKAAAKDLDGNGQMDMTDQWGFLTEDFNGYGLWASCGNRITTKDKEGYPSLSAYSEQSLDALDLINTLTKDAACTASRADGLETNGHFGEGKGLFIYGGMWLITNFRSYDVEFGILPSPKYDESQDRYYVVPTDDNCTAYAIPLTAEDPERTGAILEAMAEVSKYTLTPAYYEKTLKGKALRDVESEEMLDIILSQRWYDLGMFFNWGTMFTNICGQSRWAQGTFTSRYESMEKKAQKQIDDYIEMIEELD